MIDPPAALALECVRRADADIVRLVTRTPQSAENLRTLMAVSARLSEAADELHKAARARRPAVTAEQVQAS